jgi:ribokinase
VSRDGATRVAVVGHVEWIEFARVERVPSPGEIVHALDWWEEPGGGGAVAAVQLARLAGDCLFLTALGDDDVGHRAERELKALGVRVEVAWRRQPQRQAFVYTDANAERTITVMGERVGPRGDDPLPWSELNGIDGAYITAGDAHAVRAARGARTLVSTARAIGTLAEAAVRLDMLVSSSRDAGEQYAPGDIEPPPRLVARTTGVGGGWVEAPDGSITEWNAAPLPGPPVDTYGAGDCFAAGLTFGLAEGRATAEAVAIGARCGAACVTGRGPYAGQLRANG